MPISDPFEAQFDQWSAFEDTSPVVYAASNHSLRPSHLPPFCVILTSLNVVFCFVIRTVIGLNWGVTGNSIRNCPEPFHYRSNTLNPVMGTPTDGQKT